MTALKSLISAAVAVAISLGTASPAAAFNSDRVRVTHDIAEPLLNGSPLLFDSNPTFYQLAGQSALIQTRASSGTSGGQLDGARGFGSIEFTEVFPPAQLSEYQTYSYIGVVELHGTNSGGDDVILDRSIVIGFRTNIAVGQKIENLFPGSPNYDEATLVNQFTTQSDSSSFLDMAFNRVGGQPNTSGRMSVNFTDCHNTFVCDGPTQVQSEETLDLIAFIGGENGDEGVWIGSLGMGMTRQLNVGPVPEPETYAMLLAGLGLIGWRLRRSLRVT
jgi:hypothetical protein